MARFRLCQRVSDVLRAVPEIGLLPRSPMHQPALPAEGMQRIKLFHDLATPTIGADAGAEPDGDEFPLRSCASSPGRILGFRIGPVTREVRERERRRCEKLALFGGAGSGV